MFSNRKLNLNKNKWSQFFNEEDKNKETQNGLLTIEKKMIQINPIKVENDVDQ